MGVLCNHDWVSGASTGWRVDLEPYDRFSELGPGLGVLAIVGESGVGKTTVLNNLVGTARHVGTRVLECRASESETSLPLACLGDLLRDVSETELSVVPSPQRRALDLALLRIDNDTFDAVAIPDDRTLGTSLVTLLSRLSETTPVLVVIDDVQWLDRATARILEFALRRIEHCDVTVLVGLRSDEFGEWQRISTGIASDRVRFHRVEPLDLEAMREMFQGLGMEFTGPQLRKIHRSSGGNPFYAKEISRAFSDGIDEQSSTSTMVPERMRQLVAERLRHLPVRTQDQLLRVSALANPTVSCLDMEALAPAEDDGIVHTSSDGRVEFVHPLFAAAIHNCASTTQLRQLHAALADLVDGIEERAVHLQLSSFSPNEHVAAILSNAARSAASRGALDAAATFGMQALQFTPSKEFETVCERSLDAARYQLGAGDRERAQELGKAVLRSTSKVHRADALKLLAEAVAHDDLQSAITLLEEASTLVEDPLRSARIQLILSVIKVGVLDLMGSNEHVVRALSFAESANAPGEIAEALSTLAVNNLMLGRGFDESLCVRALQLERFDGVVSIFQTRSSLLVAMAYEYAGDIIRARQILLNLRDWLFERGSENELSYATILLAITSEASGDFVTAEVEADAALRAATWSGQELFRSFALMVRGLARARRGNLADAKSDLVESSDIASRIGWLIGVNQAAWALGYVALSENDFRHAAKLLAPLLPGIESHGVFEWPMAMPLPDIVEALLAIGDIDQADRATRSFGEWASQFDRPWALALSARCEAMVRASKGDLVRAEVSAQRALTEHDRLAMPFELARTLLVLGVVQRRVGHRKAAQESLRKAIDHFENLGSHTWADRGRAEIKRIGVRKAKTELTENETRVAELAAVGLPNREIAARLFISQRTVEANLARAYRKLGIDSRAQLGALLANQNPT